MNNKKLLIGGGIAAAIYLGYKAITVKNSISFFQYSISSIKVSLKNILQPQIIFGIEVYNPNKTGVPVNEFFGTVKYGNTTLASFNNSSPIDLLGKQIKVIDVTAQVNALALLAQLIAGKSSPTLQIDGMIKTSLFDMPVSKTVSLTGISGINDEVGKLRFLQRFLPGYRAIQLFKNKNNQPAQPVAGSAM